MCTRGVCVGSRPLCPACTALAWQCTRLPVGAPSAGGKHGPLRFSATTPTVGVSVSLLVSCPWEVDAAQTELDVVLAVFVLCAQLPCSRAAAAAGIMWRMWDASCCRYKTT